MNYPQLGFDAFLIFDVEIPMCAKQIRRPTFECYNFHRTSTDAHIRIQIRSVTLFFPPLTLDFFRDKYLLISTL